MDSRSLSRELSLISLSLINDKKKIDLDCSNINFEKILESALEFITTYCRQELNKCEIELDSASQNLLESELYDIDKTFFEQIRNEMKKSFISIETVMNTLSDTLEYPKLIAISDQVVLRNDIKKRISTVVKNLLQIDKDIDEVMDGWRFKRLPRLDRDILRIAYVDINYFNIPISVACNEAVNLANKYSDKQGRKMINGVLRRLQNQNL